MKNRITTLLIIFLFIGVQLAEGQAKKKKLPRNINMIGYDHFGPAISGDGNSMVYMSNYTNDESTSMLFTRKVNAASWKDPEELPRNINIPHLTYMNGYSLNFDGSEFYFTFKKSGGLGGYDLWRSQRQGDSWESAQNLGSPLNSALNEGSPSISSDGKALYFMSCEQMTNNEASGCKLMVSTRKNTQSKWGKPVPLSGQINRGNTLAPNILGDGETLMFMSDHEGIMQWYLSRMEGSDWQEPEAMDFIDENKSHKISVPVKARYVFHDVVGDRGRFIEQLLIPKEFRPKDVLRVIGTVNFQEGGTLKVYDVETRERKIFETLNGGSSYDFVLKEGHVYDVSFETSDKQIPAVSAVFDLTEIKFSTRKKWDINPQTLNIGDSLELKALRFDTTFLSIADQSVYELRRLARFLTKNTDSRYDINILHYLLDTATVIDEVPIETDSISIPEQSMELDTTSYIETDSLLVVNSSLVELDTIAYVEEVIASTLAEDLAVLLFQELVNKKVPEGGLSVNGITIPLKEFEGNEALANRLVVYLKKRE